MHLCVTTTFLASFTEHKRWGVIFIIPWVLSSYGSIFKLLVKEMRKYILTIFPLFCPAVKKRKEEEEKDLVFSKDPSLSLRIPDYLFGSV